MPHRLRSRRRFVKSLGMATLTAAGVQMIPRSAQPAPRRRRPNIVVILADDMGYGDLPTYGNAHARTPNLDRLAAEGLRFTDFYVSSPLCTPTRVGLLTGRQPERVGLNYLVQAGSTFTHGLSLSETTLSEALHAAGYATGIFGKWHLGFDEQYWPNKRGFDEFFGTLGGNADYYKHTYRTGDKYMYRNEQPDDPEGYLTTLFTQEAVRFIEDRRDQPFFLYMPYTAPHGPYQAPDEYLARFPDLQGDHRTYHAMIAALDDGVGAILDTIGELGLDEDTFVFFFSDNGGVTRVASNAPLRGAKNTIWEGGLRVPAIARWPGRIPAARTTDELATSLDLFPTVLKLAGVEPPDIRLDGRSILPLLRGRGPSPHRSLFWCWRDEFLMRQGRWKLIQYKDGHLALYDLERDVGETTDVAAEHPDVVKRLSPSLAEFRDTIHEGRPG